MALIHDIGESIVGDITPHDKVSDKDKHIQEKKALESLFKHVNKNNVIELWKEYEERKTPEAKFVYELDKIEMLLQAFEYEKRYGLKVNLSEFWGYVEERVKDPQIIKILKELKKKKN
jgi:putative hydrolase of HD superfamily